MDFFFVLFIYLFFFLLLLLFFLHDTTSSLFFHGLQLIICYKNQGHWARFFVWSSLVQVFLGHIQGHQLLLISPSPSCFTVFQFSSKMHVFVDRFAFFYFRSISAESCRWSVLFMVINSKSSLRLIFPKKFSTIPCVLSKTHTALCVYHLSAWTNFNLLHNSQWIIFPFKSCLLFNFRFLRSSRVQFPFSFTWHIYYYYYYYYYQMRQLKTCSIFMILT